MIPLSVILFGLSSLVFVVILILYFKGHTISGFETVLVVLATVMVVSGAFTLYEISHYVAYISVLGSLILVLSAFYNFPRSITNIAMVLSLAGAVGILMMVVV